MAFAGLDNVEQSQESILQNLSSCHNLHHVKHFPNPSSICSLKRPASYGSSTNQRESGVFRMLYAIDDAIVQQSLFTSRSDVYDPSQKYAGHNLLLNTTRYRSDSPFSQTICRFLVFSMPGHS